MGETRHRISEEQTDPNSELRALEHDIRHTREELGAYIHELNRRRHRFVKMFTRIGLAILSLGAGLISLRFILRIARRS